MACPKGMAWDSAKKKCVKVGPGQSIQNPLSLIGIGEPEYSLKGGVDWFGEDSGKPKGKFASRVKKKGIKSAVDKLQNKMRKGGSVTKWTRNPKGSRRCM